VESYMHRNTLDPLLRECYVQLLKTHQDELLKKNTGVVHLLTINSAEDLSRLYRLYSKYPEDLDPIGVLVHDHIQKAGTELVDAARPAPEVKTEEKKRRQREQTRREERSEERGRWFPRFSEEFDCVARAVRGSGQDMLPEQSGLSEGAQEGF